MEVETELNFIEADFDAWAYSFIGDCREGDVLVSDVTEALERGVARRMELGLRTKAEMWRKRSELAYPDWIACVFPSTEVVLAMYALSLHVHGCSRCGHGCPRAFYLYDIAAIWNNERFSN